MGACTLAVTFGFVLILVCKGTSWSLYFDWCVEEHLVALWGMMLLETKLDQETWLCRTQLDEL